MSKRRDIMYDFDGDLPEGKSDDAHWAVYTRKKQGGPARWAGYLDAVDVALALQYAREHYGQDEACMGIVIHRHEALTDSEYGITPIDGGDAAGDDGETWIVFTQRRRGMIHIEAGTVQAPDATTAVARARSAFADGRISNVRVVRQADCHQTTPDELAIWRDHDMSYKLARGYSKSVRSKWAHFRSQADVDQYASEDIKDHY
jgi:1,2-phenylacetyl-CoA epoxidase PaaB subunit